MNLNRNYLQNCPVCNRSVEYNNDFPDYLCNTCAATATNAAGEKVIFFHSHVASEGYQGYIRKKQGLTPFIGNTCFVNGNMCIATYDHSGGIVLQPSTDDTVTKLSEQKNNYSLAK